jgi:hypothetical protein
VRYEVVVSRGGATSRTVRLVSNDSKSSASELFQFVERHSDEIQNRRFHCRRVPACRQPIIAQDKNEENRQKVGWMAPQTLQDLYQMQTTSKAAVQKAAGYAVFNNMGTNLDPRLPSNVHRA